MECKNDLICSASEHNTTCPWHPANVAQVTLPEEAWDQLMADLDAPAEVVPELAKVISKMQVKSPTGLLEDELNEVAVIVDKAQRGVQVQAYCSSLIMRYNFNRWQLIMDEAVRRLKG